MAGFKFRLHAADGHDLGTRTFCEPNREPGDVVALVDRVYRVRDVIYLDDDSDVRGMLMLEEPSTATLE